MGISIDNFKEDGRFDFPFCSFSTLDFMEDNMVKQGPSWGGVFPPPSA